MEKHVVVCDRCGKEAKMIVDSFGMAFSPEGWRGYDEYDLCPECNEEYENYSQNCTKQFMNKRNKG